MSQNVCQFCGQYHPPASDCRGSSTPYVGASEPAAPPHTHLCHDCGEIIPCEGASEEPAEQSFMSAEECAMEVITEVISRQFTTEHAALVAIIVGKIEAYADARESAKLRESRPSSRVTVHKPECAVFKMVDCMGPGRCDCGQPEPAKEPSK